MGTRILLPRQTDRFANDESPETSARTDNNATIQKMVRDTRIQRPGGNRLLLRSNGRLLFVEPHDVLWIESNDNYVVFHTANDRHSVRMTMNHAENTLSNSTFVRIHRSTMVNFEHVRELRAVAHGDYTVVLQNGTELTLTRSYRRKVQQAIPSWPL